MYRIDPMENNIDMLDDFINDITNEYFCKWVENFDEGKLKKMSDIFSKCLNKHVETDKNTIIKIYNKTDIDPINEMDDDFYEDLFNFTKDIIIRNVIE